MNLTITQRMNATCAFFLLTLSICAAVVWHLGEEVGTPSFGAWRNVAMVCIALTSMAAILSRTLARSTVTAPMFIAVEAMNRLAQGDLSTPIVSRRRDEMGALLNAMEAMRANLNKIVGDVRSGIDSVATASNEIAQGNQDLSGRTEQQASSLQETASAMAQMTSTVRQSADNARAANQLAVSASDAASKGGDVVGQVVTTMSAISDSSKRIADIIGVIDGIAFQTNILALNAAVEAARAGEQGRGFAVVASEVRSLAQRSAEAAKEIKSLISASVEKVDVGNQQAADAGAAMNDIVSQVKRVTDLIAEISQATNEQSQGLTQVNQTVNQLDQMTQQNAALVEQSTAAAASLKSQTDVLASAVAVFTIRS